MKAIKRQNIILIFLILAVLSLIDRSFSIGQPPPILAAQSTRDTLPTRTPTPRPAAIATVAPTLTLPPVSQVWIGRIVSNTLGVTQGDGSIFRVRVDGLAGIPIELRSDDELITAESGSKPEYGPYTAEFAPVTEGTWMVTVPSLGASIEVAADNYNLAVIEFVQVPAPEATQVAAPTATAMSLDGQIWEGRLVSETTGHGVKFARLLVQVFGRNDQPVRLSTLANVINIANTGQKPDELGPYMVEFTGLTPAQYIIEPLGLNVRFDVDLKANIVTQVEFRSLPPSPPATATPLPPSPTAVTLLQPANTAVPSASPPPATATSIPTETPTPPPSPTPITRWLGTIALRDKIESELPVIFVQVSGVEGLPVKLRAVDNAVNERRCVTGQNTTERDMCAFDKLQPGRYTVSPEGLGLSLPVSVDENERVLAAFDLHVLPSGVTGWQARIQNNTNSIQGEFTTDGVIRVRVDGRVGQIVALRSVRGTEKLCEVALNPVLGGLICEFDGLGPGVYSVEALHTGAGQRIFVDGKGQAEIIFSPNATYATQVLSQTPPIVGQGAQPRRATPTVTPTQTVTVTSQPTPSPTPAPRNPTSTPTPSPTVTPTPTPAFAWQARVIEQVDGVIGTIGVRAAGLRDHPVILRSGGWQSPVQLTGTKPELGEYATEFGGLAQGEYVVELVGLAELKVDLGPNQFVLVEFRYDLVKPSPD